MQYEFQKSQSLLENILIVQSQMTTPKDENG
jgi:hypothetical protein